MLFLVCQGPNEKGNDNAMLGPPPPLSPYPPECIKTLMIPGPYGRAIPTHDTPVILRDFCLPVLTQVLPILPYTPMGNGDIRFYNRTFSSLKNKLLIPYTPIENQYSMIAYSRLLLYQAYSIVPYCL